MIDSHSFLEAKSPLFLNEPRSQTLTSNVSNSINGLGSWETSIKAVKRAGWTRLRTDWKAFFGCDMYGVREGLRRRIFSRSLRPVPVRYSVCAADIGNPGDHHRRIIPHIYCVLFLRRLAMNLADQGLKEHPWKPAERREEGGEDSETEIGYIEKKGYGRK